MDQATPESHGYGCTIEWIPPLYLEMGDLKETGLACLACCAGKEGGDSEVLISEGPVVQGISL